MESLSEHEALENVESPSVRIIDGAKDIFGALEGDTLQNLEDSIKKEGCRDRLVVWPQPEGEPILLDGHVRLEICVRLGIPYRVTACPIKFSNEEEAIVWIVRNQLARRNLTKNGLKVIGGMMYRQEKGKQGGDRKSTAQNAQLKDTADRIGKYFGVDGSTIRRAALYSEELDKQPPEIRVKILSGEMKLLRFKPHPPQEAANPKDDDRVQASNEGERADAVAEQGTGPKSEQGPEAKAEIPAVYLSLPSVRLAAKTVSVQGAFDGGGPGVINAPIRMAWTT